MLKQPAFSIRHFLECFDLPQHDLLIFLDMLLGIYPASAEPTPTSEDDDWFKVLWPLVIECFKAVVQWGHPVISAPSDFFCRAHSHHRQLARRRI